LPPREAIADLKVGHLPTRVSFQIRKTAPETIVEIIEFSLWHGGCSFVDPTVAGTIPPPPVSGDRTSTVRTRSIPPLPRRTVVLFLEGMA